MIIANRQLPIVRPQNLNQVLANWQNTLRQNVRRPPPPPTPFNFSVTDAQGGLQLSWAPVVNPVIKGQLSQQSSGPDGYEILRSPSGTFTTDLTIIKITDPSQSSYFDYIGGTATKVSYRIYATGGTPSNPQSVKGAISGVVAHTSLIPTDTVTTPTTVTDQYTSDTTRVSARNGQYNNLKSYNFFPGVK